jgi:hypothetical protein
LSVIHKNVVQVAGRLPLKTLLSPRDRNEVLDRLSKVRPDSQAQWGTMSAHQMVCHLSDSFRASLGEKYVSPSSTFLKRTLMKWAALWLPLPWPHGIKTRPEMDQQQGGTPPADFASELPFGQANLQILNGLKGVLKQALSSGGLPKTCPNSA